MRKALLVSCLLQAAVVSTAHAGGPFGNISVGTWKGGAFSDNAGNFSHCAASTTFGSGVTLVVGQNVRNGWLLGFASPNFHLNKGGTVPIDVMFDGQEQAKLFATANSEFMATAILPPNVARSFQKASLMVAVSGRTTLQFNLVSTAPLIAMLGDCVSKVKQKGLDAAAASDFTAPRQVAANDAGGGPPKPGKTGNASGTGFVISANGHIVTNHHVIDGCVSDIKGNLTGGAPAVLRVVSKDPANDMALLQGPADIFKSFAKIRDRSIRSGDAVTAIGFPFHGLLTSDFTVTTGIVSSLSGIRNDSRYLQISARRAARQQRWTADRQQWPDRWHRVRETQRASAFCAPPARSPKTSTSRSRPARSGISSTTASLPTRPSRPAPSSRPPTSPTRRAPGRC